MSIRRLFFFLLIAAVFVIAAAIPTNPNEEVYHKISGEVLYKDSPLAGVVMYGLPGEPATDTEGLYEDLVDDEWVGTVTPVRAGYSFTPSNRSYDSVISPQEDQDYIAYEVPIAGRNVNMASSKTWPDEEGDIFLQRQNEPSLAASTINPLHLLAGANDYRSVDTGDTVGRLPGIPEEANAGDAWLGVFTSYDGGESWKSTLLPGYCPEDDETCDSPIPYKAASDPTVRAGIDGLFYYSGIAFDRERNGPSVIFVARFQDYNDTHAEGAIRHINTTVIDEGTSGQFSDKPWMAVDVPRAGGYSNGVAYLVYSIFLGDITKTVHNKIMFTRSIDGGETWEAPTKLSESHRINQGTTVAIDPQNGDVYIAWRQFASGNAPDAIMVAKSTTYGVTFSKAIEAAIIDFPFDQPMFDYEEETYQFRTNAFPTITVDNYNRVYLAWAQREFPGEPARIVFTSSRFGMDWPPLPVRIHNDDELVSDDYYAGGHQFMPSMTFAAGKLVIAWYDSRDSVRLKHGGITGKWITDYYSGICYPPSPAFDHPCHWRETIDVRIAQANPGASQFEPSTFVSRYLWAFKMNADGSLARDTTTDFPIPIQVQHNPPNFPLFQGGTAAFIGDYIDIAPAPMFIKDGADWRFNTELTDPFVFYVSWADNRDVSPPAPGEYLPGVNPWTLYWPPNAELCESGLHAGMRNQNIYVSRITSGVAIGCPQNYRPPDGNQQAFVVNVENMTYYPKTLILDIINQPGDPIASFLPGGDEDSLIIDVPGYSSVSRHVFIQSLNEHSTLVQVSEYESGVIVGSVYLHLVDGAAAGGFNLSITDTGLINWSNPPSEMIPFNENLINPGVFNPGVFNPGVFNPGVFNRPLDGAEIVDKYWRVTNTGAIASSYTLKTIAGDILPYSFYNQLLVYKIHSIPAIDATIEGVDGCVLKQGEHHELLLNIVDPNVSPIIEKYEDIVDPELYNTSLTNASFSLEPGEEAVIILRVVDIHTLLSSVPFPGGFGGYGDFGGFGGLLGDEDPSVTPEEFAGNVGAVVISHSSTGGPGEVAITLMILPEILPDGKAGKPYTSVSKPIKAIGGHLGTGQHYSWQVNGLPSGLEYETVNDSDFDDMIVIYGNPWPRQDGTFLITAEVADGSSPPQTDTQTFKLYIEAAPFTLEVDKDLPLSPAVMNMPYSLKFIASGGVPWHTKPTRYVWDASAPEVLPTGLGWAGIITETNYETLELDGGIPGAPTEAGDFPLEVTVTDYSDPPKTLTMNINLCVRPPEPLDISPAETRDGNPCPEIPSNACILPDGELGSDYSVILYAFNHAIFDGSATNLTWEIDPSDKLPPGLRLSSPTGVSIEITDTPEYNVNVTYPETYTFDIQLTDLHTSSCTPVARTTSRKFTITINPKQPVWSFERDDGEATAVATDSSGNVYVTGYISGETGKDYYTIKYDENGNDLWKGGKTYDGPGNGGDDVATAIAVDSSGYVYVTGKSSGTNGYDYATLKYDANGYLQWNTSGDGAIRHDSGIGNDEAVAINDEPVAIAVDSSGNVYVTGNTKEGTNGPSDYYTVKINHDGTKGWAETYNGPGNKDDIPTAIAVNFFGVYVTGSSVGKTSGPDIYTVAYDPNRQEGDEVLWEDRYDGPSHLGDGANALTLDGDGNVYVTGYVHRGRVTKHADYCTIKYSPSGKMLWDVRYDSTRNGDDKATAIAVDSSGDVYVTGKSKESLRRGIPTTHDYFTIKYNERGRMQWQARHDGLGFGIDEVTAIAVDGSGIYVAGFVTKQEEGEDANADFFVIKYDTSGDIIWIASYDGSSGMDDTVTAMAVNSGIYVVGYSEKGSDGTAFVVVKYEK